MRGVSNKAGDESRPMSNQGTCPIKAGDESRPVSNKAGARDITVRSWLKASPCKYVFSSIVLSVILYPWFQSTATGAHACTTSPGRSLSRAWPASVTTTTWSPSSSTVLRGSASRGLSWRGGPKAPCGPGQRSRSKVGQAPIPLRRKIRPRYDRNGAMGVKYK
jgi:hypothetical protein